MDDDPQAMRNRQLEQVRETAAHAVAMLQAARDAAPAEYQALIETPAGYWLPSAISDLREALAREALGAQCHGGGARIRDDD
jgi:hypothetical protein